jgi:SMI1 / KNR4 family (SUKH-1)
MTRSVIQSTFVRLFANAEKRQIVTEDEVLRAERGLATTFPQSYLDFTIIYGAVWTPCILDLVTGGESEVPPEGASWDVHQFFAASELVESAQGYWSGGMEGFLVPVAMDCMGNAFGFRRGVAEPRPDDAPVLFFDHDFCKIHEEAESFDKWLESFVRLQQESTEPGASPNAAPPHR